MKGSANSNWVLVTGANGFLGSHLVRKLVQRGERVKAFVRAESNLASLEGLPEDRVTIAVGDVRIDHTVYRALHGCDRMYHVAATNSVSERTRHETFEDAALGTEAACEAARRAGIAKVVVTSSAGALGASSGPEPMNEEHAFNLTDANSYAAAKHAGESAAFEALERGVPVVVVRPSIVLGPGDWKPTPVGRLLVAYLEMSPNMEVPIVPGGFSYVDVEDVVDGHIRAMDRGVVGQSYLLGGDNLTHREFYEMLSDITGLAEPGAERGEGFVRIAAWFAEMVAAWRGREPMLTRALVKDYYGRFIYVDSSKAERELGYSHRPAREAASRAIRWFLENGYANERAARRVRLELRPV